VQSTRVGCGTVEGGGAARCPHGLLRGVLGPETVAGLLDHVAARAAAFRPAVVRDRTSGERRVDHDRRSSVSITDLGPFAQPFLTAIDRLVIPALSQIQIVEPAVTPRELEINAYGDGGQFAAHIDTNEQAHRVRVISCVYYFARTPRPFTGGELRIFGLPTMSAARPDTPDAYVDVPPDTDTLVFFPSWIRHEVRPVRVSSGAWLDSRFTLNCWLHRIDPAARKQMPGV